MPPRALGRDRSVIFNSEVLAGVLGGETPRSGPHEHLSGVLLLAEKPVALTDEEWTEVHRHPEMGARIISALLGALSRAAAVPSA
jgi:hypothetical protein